MGTIRRHAAATEVWAELTETRIRYHNPEGAREAATRTAEIAALVRDRAIRMQEEKDQGRRDWSEEELTAAREDAAEAESHARRARESVDRPNETSH